MFHFIDVNSRPYDIKQLIKVLINLEDSTYKANYHITKRRIIRAIEICKSSNQPFNNKNEIIFNNPLIIGLNLPREVILLKIKSRLEERLNEGMIEEVENLFKSSYFL